MFTHCFHQFVQVFFISCRIYMWAIRALKKVFGLHLSCMGYPNPVGSEHIKNLNPNLWKHVWAVYSPKSM